MLEEKVINKYRRSSNAYIEIEHENNTSFPTININKKVSLLLNVLNTEYDYSELKGIDAIYVPLKYFASSKYLYTLLTLSNTSNLYIYLPTIIRNNFKIYLWILYNVL